MKNRFIRVPDFDRRQSPKRPKKPTWLKLFVSDLDEPDYLDLSLAVRGFLADFQRLAAKLQNRVPDDVRYIARQLNTQPAVAGKALKTCLTHGLLVRFADDKISKQINDICDKSATRPIPPSQSQSKSSSPSGTQLTNVTRAAGRCAACDGEGCAWCAEKHAVGQENRIV